MAIDRVTMTMDAMVCYMITTQCSDLTDKDNEILERIAVVMDECNITPQVTVPEILAVLEKRYLNGSVA